MKTSMLILTYKVIQAKENGGKNLESGPLEYSQLHVVKSKAIHMLVVLQLVRPTTCIPF